MNTHIKLSGMIVFLFTLSLMMVGCKEGKKKFAESSAKERPKLLSGNVRDTVPSLKESRIKDSFRSPWEETFVRQPQDDSTGWYLNGKGQWIDTMRNYHQMYSFFPPYDQNKVYYTNATVHLFEEQMNDTLYRAKDKVKVLVKTLDQKPIKWLYPLRESKLLSSIDKLDFKIQEKNYTGVSGVILDNNKYEWIQFHVYQYGEVIFSSINVWKFSEDGMENTKAEINLYDLKGNLFYSVVEDAVMPTATVTLNKKYLLTCSGGQFTENEKDTKPFVGRIYDIENDEVFWEDHNDSIQITIGARQHSNWIELWYKDEAQLYPKDREYLKYILINGESDEYWEFINSDKCKSLIFIQFYPNMYIYYTTRKGDKIVENELKLGTDFKKIDHLPKK